MFYLVHFFKFMYVEGRRGYLFLLFSTFIILSSLSYFPVNKMIQGRFQVAKILPYFHALIQGSHHINPVRRKLLDLADVKKVKIKKASHLHEQAKELLTDLGLEELYDHEAYQGLQVFLRPKSENRSYLMIKEYMARLIGKSAITFGTLKYPEVSILKTKESSIRFLHLWGYWALLGIIGLLWLLSLLSIGPGIRRYGYLIEEYQRKKNVVFKMLIFGLGGLMILYGGVFSIFENIYYYSLIGVFIFMMLLSTLFCFQRKWI